ncbi:unnamed protein product, partial [Lymnaea stagnalis]
FYVYKLFVLISYCYSLIFILINFLKMTKRSKNITQLKESQISVCAACNHLRVICSCRRGAFSSLIKRTRHQWDISKETEYQQSVDDLESDLEDYHFCKKYKHHKDYVPVSRFNTSHLPEDLRHPLVCVWLRACARLVVKLKLRHNKVATGRVSFTPFDEGKSEKCDDVHCDYKTVVGAVHKVHGGITIITNKHVVSSDDEAAVARVHFFYDRKEQTVQFKELG